MKTLALFDFDGTLYKKDSLLEFTRFSKGNVVFLKGMIVLLPMLLRFKLGLLSNTKAKQRFIAYFFKDTEHEEFTTLGQQFSLQQIEKNINPDLFQKLKNHKENHDAVYIVTASFPQWIEPWSRQFDVAVIGTTVEIKNGKITGNFASENCYGIEKVNRIKQVLNPNDFDEIKVYGSGKGDYEMLQLSK